MFGFHQSNKYLVDRRGIDVELIKEDERLSIKLLMNHHTKDTHLCGTSIVQLPCPQIDHISLITCIWSKADGKSGGAEITGE